MIKKIDANKYGVVRYAITSVDELNRLPKKIAPSSRAILIENGLRVFVYGDGQWVEEVVDGDLSENMQSIVADYERSKIGYDGVKRGSLEERLKDDFQGIYDILNARDYCEYSGKELKVDNTWMGNQIDTRVEGRTLQNVGDVRNDGVPKPQYATAIRSNLLKPNTTYTLVAFNNSDEDLVLYWNNKASFAWKEITIKAKSYIVDKNYINGEVGIEPNGYSICLSVQTETTVPMDLKAILLEGDYTQTPLSELPYFEGIESVGEREIGKNLLDVSQFTFRRFDSANEGDKITFMNVTNRLMNSVPIKVDINKKYSFSVASNYQVLVNGVGDGTIAQRVEWCNSFTNVSFASEDVYVTFRRVDENSLTEEDVLKIKNTAQLEEGETATEYEPFGYIIKGKSCGKNLFDIRKWYGVSYGALGDDAPLEITEEGKVIIYARNNDTYTRTGSGGSSICPEAERKRLYLVHENTTYTLSMKCEGEDYAVNYIQFWDENYNSLGLGGHGTDTGFKITFKTPMRTKFLGIRVGIKNATVGSSLCYSDFQLEENDHATPYEPYQESTYSIHSPIPLRSLPSGVCDVYDFESGAVIQRVGKVVLDGSESWKIYQEKPEENKINTISFICGYNGAGIVDLDYHYNICDKFPSLNHYDYDLEGIFVKQIDSIRISINRSKLSEETIVGFKEWLQANPTTLYYKLGEPIIHYLTPSQLKSFEGTTHVISENTLIPTTTTKILTSTYANVSNVNSTTYSLRRGVNDVAETSAIINETDIEQDDVLDVTMCAIDELYSMLEPNLE